MNMDEPIQVASIIDELPPTWKNVKKNLKHQKDDMSLKELGKHLFVEEQYRLENKTNDDASKVHVVEEKRTKDSNDVAMISMAFSLDEEQSWWVDSGVARQVCNVKAMFKIYEPSDSILYMGNHSNTQVQGIGKVDLVFFLGNVFHVIEVCKNLMSGSILNKFGFKLVFKSHKFNLSKGGKFVGKGYFSGGMFKLNIDNVVNSSVNDVCLTDISNADSEGANN
ncbi:hypothetical protein Tco_0739772 [Tanacetum coccineum]